MKQIFLSLCQNEPSCGKNIFADLKEEKWTPAGGKKSAFSSDRSKHWAGKNWHVVSGLASSLSNIRAFSVEAESVAKTCHCTAVHSQHFSDKRLLSILACVVAFFLFYPLSRVSQNYRPTAGDVVWMLPAFLLSSAVDFFTSRSIVKCFPIFFFFMSSCCAFANCHVSKEFLIPDLDDNLHYQMQADIFIIVIYWYIYNNLKCLGFFFPSSLSS